MNHGSEILRNSIATAWTQVPLREAAEDHRLEFIARYRVWIHRMALALTAILSVMNTGALFGLVRALLHGRASNGTTLLVDALNIWITNVIVFALWFWSMDRGGPPTCGLVKRVDADFLFSQMTFDERVARTWLPGFIDYLYLSFTNATAFSPTDTPPLRRRAKGLMMAESMVSLLTVLLVAARAVNILA